jgi:nucleoside phosphorylase
MILVFYAFAREAAAFRRRLTSRAALGIDGLRGFRGRLGPTEIAGVATGLGIDLAAEAARRAMESLAPAHLVLATGVAGALIENLQTGDLVLADRLIRDGETIAVAPADLARFSSALAARRIKFATGPILTCAQILRDARAKRDAGARTGAFAVDMESAAVAAEAHRRGVPFVCLRAVLDTVDEKIVGAELAAPDGAVRPLAAAAFILRNPAAVAGLARTMRNVNRATEALADALVALVQACV